MPSLARQHEFLDSATHKQICQRPSLCRKCQYKTPLMLKRGGAA